MTAFNGTAGIVFSENHSYHTTADGSGYAQLGWSFSGTEMDVVAQNNYFSGLHTAPEFSSFMLLIPTA